MAHLEYFHDEYVRRRKWLDEQTYANLVALCQFLPGPASSQVGIGAVVGILISAFYTPIWTSSILTPIDLFCLCCAVV